MVWSTARKVLARCTTLKEHQTEIFRTGPLPIANLKHLPDMKIIGLDGLTHLQYIARLACVTMSIISILHKYPTLSWIRSCSMRFALLCERVPLVLETRS